jgi:hypothetical protein
MAMFKYLAKLNNVDGSFCCNITASQVRTGIRKKNIRRVPQPKGKADVYQMIAAPDPSDSNGTQCSITDRDMRMVCGLQGLDKKNEQQDLERLIGYGLIAENTIPRHGYIAA